MATRPAQNSLNFQNIVSIGEEELDSLPYGVIQLNPEGAILRYNAYEEGLSGLSKKKVMGKNFFKHVAPCTDVQEFYGRFRDGVAAGELNCTFRYHFPFKDKPRDVNITLLHNKRDQITWILIEPSPSK
jgi:photoactive yellow protein